MKDIKTKEVTTKPKTKNPASRIPKELMRTAILESKEKSQTIANARDNDMGDCLLYTSPSPRDCS